MPLRAPKGFIDESDPKVCQIGHPAPAWLVNYADLMTEMVCFFVILYALGAALNKETQQAMKDVKEMIEKGEVKGNVTINKDGLIISVQEKEQMAFFTSGSADLTPGMEQVLTKLAPVLKKLVSEHDIVVEGHTDDRRISNDYFDSNWELSTARSTNVVRALIDGHGFPPSRLGAIGYGQHRPIAPNDTPENRSRNRRVVFFVKNSPLKAEPAAEAAKPPAPGEAPPAAPAEAAPAPAPADGVAP